VHLRFHVRGTKRTGKGPPERLDARYIFIISPSSGGTSRERFWERSARTRNRWEPVDPSFLVQEPEYTAYLDAYPCPDERIVSLVPLTRFRYLGEAVVNGHPTWHVAGAVTRGDSVEVNLYVDRQSRRWDRIAVTFAQRLGGHLIGRQPSTVDYSRFNQPVHITAPVTGATSP
jgi:hypothetical protein